MQFELTDPLSQTNVKGTFLAIKTLLPTKNATGAAVLVVSSGTVAFPPGMAPGMSSYNASKLAQVKLVEYLAAEEPTVFAAAVHPGIHDTAVLAKSGAKPDQVPLDKSEFDSMSID
jgi:NAD(P)-dependent dehydrogenase (short-subunit alcohol dehydrogenase family)